MATQGNQIIKSSFTKNSWSVVENHVRDGNDNDYTYCYVFAPSILIKCRCAPKPNWFASNVKMTTYLRYFDGNSWVDKGSFGLSAGNSEAIAWRQFNFNNGSTTFGETDVGYCLWQILFKNTGSYPTRTHGWIWAGGIGVVEAYGTTKVYDTYCKGNLIRGNGALSLAPLVFQSSSQTTEYRQQALDHFNPDKVRGTQILASQEDVLIWPGYSFPV